MKLTPTQFKFLDIYHSGHPVYAGESDGTFMPRAHQRRTVASLVRLEWIKYQHAGIDGYKHNGYTITEQGTALHAEYRARKSRKFHGR